MVSSAAVPIQSILCHETLSRSIISFMSMDDAQQLACTCKSYASAVVLSANRYDVAWAILRRAPIAYSGHMAIHSVAFIYDEIAKHGQLAPWPAHVREPTSCWIRWHAIRMHLPEIDLTSLTGAGITRLTMTTVMSSVPWQLTGFEACPGLVQLNMVATGRMRQHAWPQHLKSLQVRACSIGDHIEPLSCIPASVTELRLQNVVVLASRDLAWPPGITNLELVNTTGALPSLPDTLTHLRLDFTSCEVPEGLLDEGLPAQLKDLGVNCASHIVLHLPDTLQSLHLNHNNLSTLVTEHEPFTLVHHAASYSAMQHLTVNSWASAASLPSMPGLISLRVLQLADSETNSSTELCFGRVDGASCLHFTTPELRMCTLLNTTLAGVELPGALQHLDIQSSPALRSLGNGPLPAQLRSLAVDGAALAGLAEIPASLKALGLGDLPAKPFRLTTDWAELCTCRLSNITIQSFPGTLPASLQALDLDRVSLQEPLLPAELNMRKRNRRAVYFNRFLRQPDGSWERA